MTEHRWYIIETTREFQTPRGVKRVRTQGKPVFQVRVDGGAWTTIPTTIFNKTDNVERTVQTVASS